MKKLLLVVLVVMYSFAAFAQEKANLYNPEADAKKDITNAIAKAQKEGKHVFLQIGGNWCSWCIKFHKFVENDIELKELLESNYVVLKVNYSKENKNLPVLAELGYPQRFGFPVFVILDGKGNRIHTQDTGLLENGEGYDKNKVASLFQKWSPVALKSENYK